MSEHPTVILLHGLALGRTWMRPMAWRLARRGWHVQCIGYHSRRQSFASSLAEVRRQLPPDVPLHLAGHSLGGLIAAALLHDPHGLDIGRVVQIGSPSLGSPMADRALNVLATRRFYGPVLKELCEHTRTPTPDPRIGAIAGIVRPNLAGGDGDGTVRLQSAVAAAADHVTVRITHSLLPVSATVAGHVADFLTHGRFTDQKA